MPLPRSGIEFVGDLVALVLAQSRLALADSPIIRSATNITGTATITRTTRTEIMAAKLGVLLST